MTEKVEVALWATFNTSPVSTEVLAGFLFPDVILRGPRMKLLRHKRTQTRLCTVHIPSAFAEG